MNIGIPKERRPFEFRVGLPPAGVEILKQHGHAIFVEHEAGVGAGFSDEEYERAGARIVYSPEEVFGRADFLLEDRASFERRNRVAAAWLDAGGIVASCFSPAGQDRPDAQEQDHGNCL